jgi:hypothetical protein
MNNTFKTEYIAELMIAGYTKDEAEEQYQMELKSIKQMDLDLESIDDDDCINYDQFPN